MIVVITLILLLFWVFKSPLLVVLVYGVGYKVVYDLIGLVVWCLMFCRTFI